MIFLKPLSVVKDSRRTLSNLFRADIKDVNFYEAKKGSVLGNHYHKKTDEYFFIVKGICLVHTPSNKKMAMKGALFVIKPPMNHSIECITDCSFITFLTEPYDSINPDIFKEQTCY